MFRRAHCARKLCLAAERACGHGSGRAHRLRPCCKPRAASKQSACSFTVSYVYISIYPYTHTYICMHIDAHTSLHTCRSEGDIQFSMSKPTFFACRTKAIEPKGQYLQPPVDEPGRSPPVRCCCWILGVSPPPRGPTLMGTPRTLLQGLWLMDVSAAMPI